MYDIKNLNIWKADSQSSLKLTKSPVKEIRGLYSTFPVYMGDKLMKADIDMLNLSVRSANCMRRTGWNTVGDLVNNIDDWSDLMKIRNCGMRSIKEIMEKLEKFQLSLFGPGDQAIYNKKCEKLTQRIIRG